MTESAKSDDNRRHTCWFRSAAWILSYARSTELDVERHAAGCGLDLTLAPDARVPLDVVYALIESVDRAVQRPCLGIEIARTLTMRDLDAIAFLSMSSTSLRQLFGRVERFQAIWGGERMHTSSTSDGFLVHYAPVGPPRPAHRVTAELALFDLVVSAPAALGIALSPRHVSFNHAASDDDREAYEAAFGCPVRTNAPLSGVTLDPAVLDVPFPSSLAFQEAAAFFERWAREQMAALPQETSLSDHVRAVIEESLPDGPPSLESLAKRFALSERSLQRRLRDEETSLVALVDEVRKARATILLSSGLPTEEVAHVLGYSEASSFQRARRRWSAGDHS